MSTENAGTGWTTVSALAGSEGRLRRVAKIVSKTILEK